MTELLDLHVEHFYYIKAQKLIELNAVTMIYPSSVIYNEKSLEEIYIYHSVNDCLIIYQDEIDNEPLCQLKSPNYTHRILLLEDVYLKCIQHGLDAELVVCVDESGDKLECKQPLLKLMSAPDTDEDKQKEKNLSALFFELVLGEDGLDKADKFNVVDGYHIISNVLENRGICK